MERVGEARGGLDIPADCGAGVGAEQASGPTASRRAATKATARA